MRPFAPLKLVSSLESGTRFTRFNTSMNECGGYDANERTQHHDHLFYLQKPVRWASAVLVTFYLVFFNVPTFVACMQSQGMPVVVIRNFQTTRWIIKNDYRKDISNVDPYIMYGNRFKWAYTFMKRFRRM